MTSSYLTSRILKRYFWERQKKIIKFLILVTLLIGLFFRFYHLNQKVYWFDETFTSLRIAGYSDRAVVQELSNASIIGVEDLQKYQRLNSEKNLFDTVNTLAVEEPQLTPLYFVLARFWAQLFGQSIIATRLFPVFTSLLAFPCLYWLCQELFSSVLVSGYALSLFAVSPFFLIYAQEARPYSLWMLIILASSAALLRAIRLQSYQSWLVYLGTAILGFYSHLYFALVILAHGLYVIILERFKWSYTVKAFSLTFITSLMSFIPWILIVFVNVSSVYNTVVWEAINSNNLLRLFIQSWLGNIGRVYIDLGTVRYLNPLLVSLFFSLTVLIVILVAYALYFLCKTTDVRTWLFVLTLCGVNAITLSIHNIFIEKVPIGSRYLIPFHLGIIITIAYLFSKTTINLFLANRHQRLWRIILGFLLSCQIFSCFIYSQSETWWNKGLNDHQPSVANIINHASRPLVIIEANRYNVFNLISLSYRLNSTTHFLVANPTNFKIPSGFSTLFIYGDSKFLRQKIQQDRYKPIPIYPRLRNEDIWLWRINR